MPVLKKAISQVKASKFKTDNALYKYLVAEIAKAVQKNKHDGMAYFYARKIAYEIAYAKVR